MLVWLVFFFVFYIAFAEIPLSRQQKIKLAKLKFAAAAAAAAAEFFQKRIRPVY